MVIFPFAAEIDVGRGWVWGSWRWVKAVGGLWRMWVLILIDDDEHFLTHLHEGDCPNGVIFNAIM